MEKIIKYKKIFIGLLPLILAVNFTCIIVYYAVNYVNPQHIQNTLIYIEPIFLLVNFTLLIAFFILNFKDIINCLKNIKRYAWFTLILIFIVAAFLRFYVVPHTHRVFFDEDIYLDIGKEILTSGKACLCNYGDTNGCYECQQMKWPSGYPFLLSVTFSFFGISENVAFILVSLLGSLSVILVFLIAYLLLKNEKVAIYSAILFALIPVHIMWSGTTASEPVLVFFTLLAAFFFLISFRVGNWKMHTLAVLSIAYALQIKSEGIVLLPIILIMILLLDRNKWKRFTDKKFIFAWILFIVLIIPYFMHTYYSSLHESWGSTGEMFDFKYAKTNIPENFWFWVAGYPTIEHPVLFTVLMVIGLFYLLKKDRCKGIAISLWFILFFLFYGFFYAGSVRYGVDVRYALSGYPPYIILAGYGIFSLTMLKKNYEDIISFILIGIILVSFYFYLPSIKTAAEDINEAKQARIYHDFAISTANDFDKNCYILTHVPSMYLITGKNSLQTWYGENKNVMNDLFNKTDCIIFDDGFWCNVEPYKSSVCKRMFDDYKLEEISSLLVDTHNYTFYYVKKE